MLNDATYKNKYILLQDWIPGILDLIKKDLKNEHLRQDILFVKKYLNNKNLNKITQEELVTAYNQAVAEEEKAEEIAEFIFNRWLLKNTDLYGLFEQELSRINPNFTELKSLEPQAASAIMEKSISQHGAVDTYLFAIINSVVFPQALLEQLKERAKSEAKKAKIEQEKSAEMLSQAMMVQKHQEQINRLTDKYEKKLAGMEKKYLTDVNTLKKQIAALQRKLNGA